MTAEPPENLAEMIAAGLSSYNADDFVPQLPERSVSFENPKEGIRLTFTTDDLSEVKLVHEFEDPRHDYRMRLGATFEYDDLVQLYEQVIKPLMDREAEVKRLADAADAAHEAEQKAAKQVQDAHVAASAFRIQSVSSRKIPARSYPRLHKDTCHVVDKAEGRGITAVTLDELLTEHLPRFRERYEELLSPEQVSRNFSTRSHRAPLDNTVVALCGACKPIGPQSRFVTDELDKLAHQVVHNPDNMVELVRLLVLIENGAKETDAAYHEARR